MNARFAAPWGTPLRVISALTSALCVGLAVFLPEMPGWARVLLLALLGVAALFIVRRYDLTPDALLIVRPFWSTRIQLAGLRSTAFVPDALRGSIRTCGNGGLYSFTGWYWSRGLGHHRAFVTDLKRVVVLRFERRTVVVSPDQPEEFVRSIEAACRDGGS